jgi:DNA-binding transcriptional ArsR family regulator
MNELDAHSRQMLACLGDASRFRLVHSLLQCEQCVSDLAVRVGLSQSCTTRHLQYLEREGLVRGRRQGKRVMFRLRSDLPRVQELLAWVMAAHDQAERGQIAGAAVHVERPVPAADRGARTGGGPALRSTQPVRRARGERRADPSPGSTGPDGVGGGCRLDRSPAAGKSGAGAPPIPQPSEGPRRSDSFGSPSGSQDPEPSGRDDPLPVVPDQAGPGEPVEAEPHPPAPAPAARTAGTREMEDWLL